MNSGLCTLMRSGIISSRNIFLVGNPRQRSTVTPARSSILGAEKGCPEEEGGEGAGDLVPNIVVDGWSQ